MSLTSNKERFFELLDCNVGRPGLKKLLAWLETTDFFVAPASTRFHEAYEGGLLEHSLAVYDAFNEFFMPDMSTPEEKESAAICTLLHDLCKANFYVVELRNRKNERGAWEKVPFYTVQDQFAFGHGEKSVYLIERFMRLKPNEAIAIRWHMGGFDDAARGGSFALSNAYDEYPLAVAVHLSDMIATYGLREGLPHGFGRKEKME